MIHSERHHSMENRGSFQMKLILFSTMEKEIDVNVDKRSRVPFCSNAVKILKKSY